MAAPLIVLLLVLAAGPVAAAAKFLTTGAQRDTGVSWFLCGTLWFSVVYVSPASLGPCSAGCSGGPIFRVSCFRGSPSKGRIVHRNTHLSQTVGMAVPSVPTKRGLFGRAVCVLCIALVCVLGTVQATHSHPANSSTSHHTCSICATAHIGFNTHTVASAPALATTALAISVAEVFLTFRPLTDQFIRPPPAL
jgi:hypothetical protein